MIRRYYGYYALRYYRYSLFFYTLKRFAATPMPLRYAPLRCRLRHVLRYYAARVVFAAFLRHICCR